MKTSGVASGVDALEAPVTTARQDLVTTATGLWLVLGLFTDGWAHVNLPGLESFFTPWHAVLYSGFGATAAWIALLGWRNRRSPGGRLTSVWPRVGTASQSWAWSCSGSGDWVTCCGTSPLASK